MRTRAAVLVLLAAGVVRPAHAEDPRDLFGIGKPPATAEPDPGCDAPRTFGCATVTDPLDDASPYRLSTWLPSSYLRRLPVANASHDAISHYGLGAGRDEAGPTFGGATGLENRWTIDGAPVDSIRTGGIEARIPLTFLEGITVTAGGFAARDRTSTGGTIDARLVRGGNHHDVEASAWAGLSGSSRERPYPNLTYSVRRLTFDAGPEVSASAVATGPLGRLLGGQAWYAAGVAPALGISEATWRAGRLTDLDGDAMIDLNNGQFVVQPIAVTRDRSPDFLVPFLGRAGLDRGPHAIDLTLFGHAGRSRRWLQNATLLAAGTDRTTLVVDGIATWNGRWEDTRATVQLAWHRSTRNDAPTDAAANVPQLLTAYIPTTLPDDQALADGCHDMTFPGIPQCPVPFGYFASAGAGPLVEAIGDRPTVSAEIARRRGAHVVRAGATLEDARQITRSRLTGGEQQRSLFDGHLDRLRYYQGDCGEDPGTPCDYVEVSELRYRTRYTAAFLQDTFSPGERFRVDGGLRWELMWVGPRLHFSRQLAPRLGVAWDPLGGGRSRLWISMGRSYAMLPTGLGPTVIDRDATVHDASSTFGDSRNHDAGAVYSVVRGIAPMAQDEVTAGVELGITKAIRVVAWIQGRWLRRGLETTLDGFDNPGRNEGLPARRDSEQVALEVVTAPTPRSSFRAGYLGGRTRGNFLGPYDPRRGAILYDGDDWNGDASSSNLMGRLPTDVGHRVFVEGRRGLRSGAVELELATRLTVSSGRPRSAFGNTDVGVLALIPRGSVGRGPMLTQANVRLAAHWRGFDLMLDVFNAFDRSAATLIEETYAQGVVRAIEGGSYEDLVFLKTPDGANPSRLTGYGLPLVFQGPISANLGLQRAF